MKVLVVGSGGREHALCWKLAQSPRLTKLYAAPGNAGCAQIAECVDIKGEQLDALVGFVHSEKIDLTIVGPEGPLCMGLVDRLERAGRKVFGPTKEAALLEGSKVFAKSLMRKHNIPTADYKVFNTSRDAKAYLERAEYPLVVKADGLASGKGVRVAQNRDDALEHLLDCMERGVYGEAGSRVVIEEALKGQEASVLVVTDGRTLAVLETARDYKRARDGDQGPNTGGMGALSPAPGLDAATMKKVEQKILIPAIHAMNREGHPMKGVLYAGLMLTVSGPRVLEFNVRFGDPETQPMLLRLKTDLLSIVDATVNGTLEQLGHRVGRAPGGRRRRRVRGLSGQARDGASDPGALGALTAEGRRLRRLPRRHDPPHGQGHHQRRARADRHRARGRRRRGAEASLRRGREDRLRRRVLPLRHRQRRDLALANTIHVHVITAEAQSVQSYAEISLRILSALCSSAVQISANS